MYYLPPKLDLRHDSEPLKSKKWICKKKLKLTLELVKNYFDNTRTLSLKLKV